MSGNDNEGLSRKRPRLDIEENSIPSPHDTKLATITVETPVLFTMELCIIPDFTLIVGENLGPAREFGVSRLALCCASPVFRAMLAGPFIESTKKLLVLEDGNPEALLAVLRIAHMRFHCSLRIRDQRRTHRRCYDLRQVRYGSRLSTLHS